MDLRSPSAYWLLRHGIINSYPSLDHDIKTDCAIIGAGISGALLANALSRTGRSVVVLDRRHVGTGSTAASTALLQYEIDTPMHELAGMIGSRNATRSYLLCLQAIDELERICERLPYKGLFRRRPSFQFASHKKDVPAMEKEFRMRKEAGIRLQLLDNGDVQSKFGFNKAAGLLSADAAEADAYRITHSLLEKLVRYDVRVFDNTTVDRIRHEKKSVLLRTADGKQIHAKTLFIACGYESQQYLPFQVQTLHSTYAITSEPFADGSFWHRNALIWETARPYLYLRTTDDKRILVGGKDIPFTSARQRDRLLSSKTRALETSFRQLFPALPFKTDFQWAGVFASTKDGLPYIGSVRQRPHTHFALGFGGNGITFSVLAARLLAGEELGRKEPDLNIFSFDR